MFNSKIIFKSANYNIYRLYVLSPIRLPMSRHGIMDLCYISKNVVPVRVIIKHILRRSKSIKMIVGFIIDITTSISRDLEQFFVHNLYFKNKNYPEDRNVLYFHKILRVRSNIGETNLQRKF